MGIGISYTGHDGKTRRFASGEDARSFLDSMGAAAKRHTGDALRDAMARIPSAMKMQQNKASVMPGGSVVDSQNGLCLRGEEQSPLIEGKRVFASVNGSKGFKTLSEIDPPGSAPVCGPMFGCDSEDEDAGESHGGEAVRIPFVSRTKMSIDETTGMVVLYEFVREMAFSPEGRMVGCTKERRRVVGSFMPGEGGGGNGKYGARPMFVGESSLPSDEKDKPMLDFIAFGTETDLDTWDGEKFACNYNGGVLLDNPPVKMVLTDTCAYNPLTGGD